MKMKRKGFFGADNLHRAGWAVLIGLVGFLGALTYQKIFGPQRILVETISTPGPGTRITTVTALRSNEVQELAEAIRELAKATSTNVDQRRVRELSNEVDRLSAEVARSAKSNSPLSSSPLIGDTAGKVPGKESASKFVLPESVLGYRTDSLFGVSASTCPPDAVSPEMILRVTFDLDDATLMSRATPIRATVARELTSKKYQLIDEVWSEIQAGTNTITLTPFLEPGRYHLAYGFYLRNSLLGKYPKFYSRDCFFFVIDSAILKWKTA